MKKLLLLFMVCVMIPLSSVFSQVFEDYVKEFKGDTAVIKDYNEAQQEINTLSQALALDTDPPAGRVYMLVSDGWYPNFSNPATKRSTVIVGEDNTILVNSTSQARPPLITGYTPEGEATNTGSFNIQHNLTVKNCSVVPSDQNRSLGWSYFNGNKDSVRITLQNNLFERTRWVFMNSGSRDIKWYLKNNYFVNMIGQPCRRNGGVIDVFAPQDTLWVENNTHINAQGMMYKLRANQFNRVIVNHNTFVNMSSYVFSDLGSQSAMSVTNNIFVNCQVQPYGPINADVGEEDIDKLPTGLVNVYPDTAVHVERKYLVDKNVIYWDPRLADIADSASTLEINQTPNWVSQMITMNSRTQDMFDNDATYPYLTEGQWIEELPSFTDSQDLLTDWVDELYTFSLATCDTNDKQGVLPDWRINNIGPDFYLYSDFPIPVDLSYDNETLLTAGMGQFPVGDLNWFPETKTEWLAQRDAEYAAIQNELDTGVLGIEGSSVQPVTFQLQQNYPNPFNPSTVITFTIPKSGNVTLKVYNSLGQEVATLINGVKTAQTYNITFDGSGLASGVYFYALKYDNNTISKKMILMK
jgi:hypothetical protein